MLSVVEALLPIGLLPMLTVFQWVVRCFHHFPYNTRGTTQATRQSVSKRFLKVSYLYISLKKRT